MAASQPELLQRIESFVLDQPDAALTFSQRLAREQGWSLDFTHRAIREYKRFLFLAMEAGHAVSPSEVVDHVWHQHLTFTRSYWTELCGQVLGRPLHHEPTRGGAVEAEKFRDWYAQTLASYERLFREPPPRDLWPPHPTSGRRFTWRKFAQHFAWPRPRKVQTATRAVALGGVAVLLAGCASYVAGLGPLDLRGPEFLELFGLLAAGAIIFGFIVRYRARHSVQTIPEQPENMSAYSIALLAGRDVATIAALAQLLQTEALSVATSQRQIRHGGALPADSHPLEQILHRRIQSLGSITTKDAIAYATPVLQEMEGSLRTNGLLLPEETARHASVQASAACGVVFLFGVAKILVGVSRDRPVGFLIICCLGVLIAGLVFLTKKPRRTAAGDEFLDDLRAEHAALHHGPLRGVPAFGGACLPLAVALFGYGVLDQTQAADLRKIIPPPASGGGGDGCGSGCGGGGGCGGGCGGCGGGGD